MPRSRKFRKSQNQVKPEWGKNNPQTKAKNKKLMMVVGIIAVAVIVGASFLVLGQNSLFASPSSSPTPSVSPTATPPATPLPSASALTSPAGEYSANGTRILFDVHFTNSSGQSDSGGIIIQMRDDKPITTQNFVNLVKQGLFDGTIFHRVISGFMIQGGMNTTVNVPSIADEIGNNNRNIAGSIAMAKTSDPNSATSQFFINVADNGNIAIDQQGTRFDSVYTQFGQVIYGMDTVMKISQVTVQPNSQMGNENSQPVSQVTLVDAIVLP